ncbi:MAG: hypothetical protein ACAH80_10290 [Alphaproteobacteria bacterium]
MSENLSSGSSGENLSSRSRSTRGENLASKPSRQQTPPRRPAKIVEEPKADQPIKVMKKIELKKKKD